MRNPNEPHKTILVKSFYSVQCEANASGAVTPGDLVERIDGDDDTIRAQATAAANAQRAFALEDDLQGKGIDDNYADAAVVKFRIFMPGDEVLARIATSQTLVKGDKLESAGGGLLRKLADGVAIAVVRQAVVTTDAVKRAVVEIM